MKILLVDDNACQREALGLFLRRELRDVSPEIIEARNASAALLAIEKKSDIDVVVLDQRMGSEFESGISFLARLPSHSNRPRVLVLTSHPGDIDAEEFSKGDKPIDFFLEKGVPDTLIAQAVRMMALSRQGILRYGEEDIFGVLFCKELEEVCQRLENDRHLETQTLAFTKLIRSCARTFMISRGRSIEDLFNYVVAFSEAACTIAGLPNGFNELLRKLPDVERALYRIPTYRDHVIHQMQVFLLGFCVLSHMRQGMTLNDPMRKALGLDDGSWIRRWFLVSAFHDIGYPFEKMGNWLNTFFTDMLCRDSADQRNLEIPCTFNWGAIIAHDNHLDNFTRLLGCMLNDIRATDSQKASIRRDIMTRVVERPDHGVLSALILLSLSGTQDTAEAAVAVCLHSIATAQCVRKKLGRHLEFEEIPWAFLLAFCDTVQEWGRSNSLSVRRKLHDFGNPRFHSIRYENGIHLELVYAQEYPEELQEQWQERIFKDILTNTKLCWSSDSLFHVSYYWQSEAGKNILLERLEM